MRPRPSPPQRLSQRASRHLKCRGLAGASADPRRRRAKTGGGAGRQVEAHRAAAEEERPPPSPATSLVGKSTQARLRFARAARSRPAPGTRQPGRRIRPEPASTSARVAAGAAANRPAPGGGRSSAAPAECRLDSEPQLCALATGATHRASFGHRTLRSRGCEAQAVPDRHGLCSAAKYVISTRVTDRRASVRRRAHPPTLPGNPQATAPNTATTMRATARLTSA